MTLTVRVVFMLIIILITLLWSVSSGKKSLETKFIEVPIDHFDVINNQTFKLRYLVYKYHHVKGGPIFLYTGNEGDINMFAKNTGFLFDIAPLFNALVVFAEHRYYGHSLPFGNESFSTAGHMRYLTSSQALKDFVCLIEELKKTNLKGMISRDTHPIVAFGGSYGGMLAAWLRVKYPYAVIGSIASSAPVWYFGDLTPCDKFYQITTQVFSKFGGENCTDTIKSSWAIFRNITKFEKGERITPKIYFGVMYKSGANLFLYLCFCRKRTFITYLEPL